MFWKLKKKRRTLKKRILACVKWGEHYCLWWLILLSAGPGSGTGYQLLAGKTFLSVSLRMFPEKTAFESVDWEKICSHRCEQASSNPLKFQIKQNSGNGDSLSLSPSFPLPTPQLLSSWAETSIFSCPLTLGLWVCWLSILGLNTISSSGSEACEFRLNHTYHRLSWFPACRWHIVGLSALRNHVSHFLSWIPFHIYTHTYISYWFLFPGESWQIHCSIYIEKKILISESFTVY